MEIKKKMILPAILAAALAGTSSAFAAEETVVVPAEQTYELSTTPPTESHSGSGGISTQGAYPPSSGSAAFDLNQSVYQFNVDRVGTRVFTDKLLTGGSSIKVTVKNWQVLQASEGSVTDQLTIRLYDSSRNKIGEKTINPFTPPGTNAVLFSGLSSSKKYYVEFDVNGGTYNNRYSFNGSILRP